MRYFYLEKYLRVTDGIGRKDRLLLGTLFLNWVKSENSNIKILEKTYSVQQKYIITNKMWNWGRENINVEQNNGGNSKTISKWRA